MLENEVFAGEGLTDPIKPGERRLLSYATDLGLLVEAQKNSRPQHATLAKISKGILTQVSKLEERTLYTVRNQDDAARILVVKHPARGDWSLAKGSKEPEERSPGVNRSGLRCPRKRLPRCRWKKNARSTPLMKSPISKATRSLFL